MASEMVGLEDGCCVRKRANPVRRMWPAVLLTIGAALSTAANAGVTSATIDRILIFGPGNLIYVYPTGGVNSPPACHGSNGNYYSFAMSRNMAREYLSGLLAAQARGAVVEFYGTGACTDQSVSETLNYFTIVQ